MVTSSDISQICILHVPSYTLSHMHTHCRLRLLLHQLDQGETPEVEGMKNTILFAADVLLGLVPSLKPIDDDEERE